MRRPAPRARGAAAADFGDDPVDGVFVQFVDQFGQQVGQFRGLGVEARR